MGNTVEFYNIIGCVEAIGDFLEKTYKTIEYAGGSSKDSTAGVDGFADAVPKVFLFCCPPNCRNKQNFPQVSPSITLMVEGVTPGDNPGEARVSMAAYSAVWNGSTNSAETAREISPHTNDFVLGDDLEYSSKNAQYELYKCSLRAGLQLYEIIDSMRCTSFDLTELSFTPPDRALRDFPYSQSLVEFTVIIRRPKAEIFGQAYQDLL